MTHVAYLDESIRGARYIIGVAIVPAYAESGLARSVRSLHLPGQRRLHLKTEHDRRRRMIVDSIVGLGYLQGWIYQAPRPVLGARRVCLESLIEDLIAEDISQLIIERADEGQDQRDRAIIHDALGKEAAHVAYRHAPPWEYAGLQVADAIAWCYGSRHSDWRRRIRPIISRVRDLG